MEPIEEILKSADSVAIGIALLRELAAKSVDMVTYTRIMFVVYLLEEEK